MADTKLTGLSEVSVPDMADMLYLVDVSDTADDAAGSSRKCGATRLGGMLDPAICNFRLTLESGVPVSTTDKTDKTTIYLTPYNGNRIAVYDGTRWKLYTPAELSLALGTLTSGKNYDVFIYDNSGTLTLELSSAWTNDTTRADALTTQDGIYVKSGATTRRLLGTIRTTSTTTTEDSGSPAAGTTPKRFVSNLYNRVPRFLRAIEDADSWTYGTNTWRSANNDNTNRLEFVNCLADVPVACGLVTMSYVSSASESLAAIGVDSTSSPSGEWIQSYSASQQFISPLIASYSGYPGLGYHYLQWIEKSRTNTNTFYGDNATDDLPGIRGWVMG